MAAADPSSHRKLSLKDRTRAKFDSLLRSLDKQQSKKASKKSPKKADDQAELQKSKSSSLSSDSTENTSGYTNPVYLDDHVPKKKKPSTKLVQSDSTSSTSKSHVPKSFMGSESSISSEEEAQRKRNATSTDNTASTNSDDDPTPEAIVQQTIRESVWEKTMNVTESSSAFLTSNSDSLQNRSSSEGIVLERQPPEKPYEIDDKKKPKKKVSKSHDSAKDTSAGDSDSGIRKLRKKLSRYNGQCDTSSLSVRSQESSKAGASFESNDALMSVWTKDTSVDSSSFDNGNAITSLELTSLSNTARQKRRARKQQSVNHLSLGEVDSEVTVDLQSLQQSSSDDRKNQSNESKTLAPLGASSKGVRRVLSPKSSPDAVALSHITVPKKRAKSVDCESQDTLHGALDNQIAETAFQNESVSHPDSTTSSVVYRRTNSPSTSFDSANVIHQTKAKDISSAARGNALDYSSESESADDEITIAKTPTINIEHSATDSREVRISKTKEKKKVMDAKTETVKKKKKKKKKTKSVEETAVAAEEPSSEATFSEVLGVLIHRVDGLKMNLLICHPVVQVHIFDINTGNYLLKKHQEQSVASYYENQSSPVKHIMAVMTQPYHMSGKENLIPEWQELLVFNEDYNYFVQEDPSVILFFEILDFVSMNQASRQYKYLGKDGGWCRIAWAFLKLVGANSVLNVSKRLRLQLYYPPKTKWGSSCVPNSAKEVYAWWRKGLKKKYPYTLYVTIKPITPPEVHPGLRSMIPTQEERGRETLEELEKNLTQGKTIVDSHTADVTVHPDPRWSRLPGQACKIPETIHLSLQAGRSGCFVVRFSCGGRFLACGSINGQGYPILIFEIPSGKLQGKLIGHFGIIYDIIWLPDDKTVLSVSADCTLRLWDISNAEHESSIILPHPSYIYAAAHHPKLSNIVVSGCYDNIVRVWRTSVSECELLQELPGHNSFINSVCFDEDGGKFYSGDGIGMICMWSNGGSSKSKKKVVTKDWFLLQKIQLPELKNIAVNDIIRHPGGHRLLLSSRDNCVRLVDAKEFTVLHTYKGFQNLNDHMHCCITPCATYVISGSEDGTIYVWQTNTEEMVFKYTKLRVSKTITTVDYHPQEHMMAVCAYGENLPVMIFKHKTSAPPAIRISENLESSLTSITTPISEASRVQGRPPSGILKRKQLASERIIGEHQSFTSVADLTDTPSSETVTRTAYPVPYQDIGLTTADRQRTVTFEDEISPPTKWSDMFAKIDAVLAFSSLKREPSNYLPPLKFDSSTPINSKTISSATSMMDTASSWGSTFDQDTLEEYTMQSSLENFKVVALYAYAAAEDDHLSLQVGDQILVLRKINDDWWYGRDCNGKNGLFPANYVFPAEESHSGSSSPTPGASSTTLSVPSRTPKRKTRRTHAIPSQKGSRPLFVSGSEDEEYTA